MKLIIEIPEEIVEWINKYSDYIKIFNEAKIGIVVDAINNGTLLPKGHGEIKDVSQIEIPMCEDRAYERWVQVAINSAPTIIEADKEYEAEVITRGNCMMCGKELDEGLFFCKECEAKAESEDKE